MVYYEADDALASAAAKAAQDDRVNQVFICTPDKDLGQCVVGTRVVQLDRRQNILRDEAGVVAKFGVKPESIPDYLAVVGDSADGFPASLDGERRRRLWSFPISAPRGHSEKLAGMASLHPQSSRAGTESLFTPGMTPCFFAPCHPATRCARLRCSRRLRWKRPGPGI